MREAKEEIITVPGLKSIVGEDGKPIPLQIKTLSRATIREIQENYRTRSIALNKNGNPYISGNEVVFQTENDADKAACHILAEALVFPNLKDKELMDYYKCYDIADMPLKVFPQSDEFSYVNRMVLAVLGLSNNAEDEKLLKEAKN